MREDQLTGSLNRRGLDDVFERETARADRRGTPLPEERIRLLVDLSDGVEEVGVAEMPADSQVCNCNGVDKATIVGCVAGGTTSVAGVMAATRAGKGCGSCKGLVAQVVEWAAGDAVTEDPSANWYVPAIPYEKPELMRLIRELKLYSVRSVFAALAPDGKEDANSKMGLSSLLEMMWGSDFIDERAERFINDRVHANIQRDGTFSVVPQMKGGVTNVEQLRKIADVAEKYSIPMIKATGGQRIDLLGVKKEDLPAVWADLGMPSGYAYGKSFRTVKTCVGTDYCRFGLGDSTQLGIDIETRYQGLESPAKLKLAVTGCPRNCAEALCKDLGVVAIDGGKWEIYVGGAAGTHIRKGDLLATLDSRRAVIEAIIRLAERVPGVEFTAGQDALPILGLDRETVEINVTPDRGYCFCLRGVAREYSHSTGAVFTDPADDLARRAPAANDSGFGVQVADDAPLGGKVGCTRYVARTVRGIDPSAPTPEWMATRLTEAGMRPISLAVDVTNYVMLELGQPMHAFDRDEIHGGIVVRMARIGEKLVLLDGFQGTG